MNKINGLIKEAEVLKQTIEKSFKDEIANLTTEQRRRKIAQLIYKSPDKFFIELAINAANEADFIDKYMNLSDAERDEIHSKVSECLKYIEEWTSKNK